ncbi:hypothetical protein [Streptomyces avermitilis]|uniref:hypothetical protein n=1 Tax=Streptomyces avermitilis TaxID=33903 RepID=UPI0033ACAB87
MSWKWEYAFGAEQAARTAPAGFLSEVERTADELVRATYQVVVRSERVYIVQITYLGF